MIIKKAFLLVIHSFFGMILLAQNDSTAKVDVFLSKSIVKQTELKGAKLLSDIDVSSNQNLVLSSSNCFYCIGYGEYASRKMSGKKISTFCVLDNDVYFADKSNLYKIGTDNQESRVICLSFVPRKIWSGKQVIYAVCRKGKSDNLYAIFPEQRKTVQFYSSSSLIVGVDEFGPLVCILTENNLVIVNVKDQEYTVIPVNVKETGKLISLAIDQTNGDIYLSSANGVYRAFEEQFQKVCRDVGILCYSIDGMLIFNNKDPFVIRLRNNLLYPVPKGVIIEIK
jgi:hypothetical protein